MGLLDGTDNLYYRMQADVYYATDEQNKFGAMDKTWTMDRTVDCELWMLDKIVDRNNFTFDDPEFYRINNLVRGRSPQDIRVSSTGEYHPMSHILVTNLRTKGCAAETIFISPTNGESVGKPIVYVVSTCNPFVGPFNNIEFYKLSLKRADDQGLI